ncbi:MAG: hypothetical protein JSU86_09840 [Phycisphaerales bacterium]|nr:MAG: hypothetical protein JSU86_09840 [Phycisphaerales bacterium]
MAMDSPSQPTTPPRVPGAIGGQAQPSGWPTAIGVIAIVLGGLGCLGGCWGAVSPLFMGVFVEMVPQSQAAMFDQFQEWGPWITVSSLVAAGLAVLLLADGIGILRHRRWAVRAAYCWAGLKMVYVVASTAWTFTMQQEQFQAMAQQNLPGIGGGFFVAMGAFSVGFGIVWGWALPVFFLVWFSLPKIRREVAGWS